MLEVERDYYRPGASKVPKVLASIVNVVQAKTVFVGLTEADTVVVDDKVSAIEMR
jgi:hypothetical protein